MAASIYYNFHVHEDIKIGEHILLHEVRCFQLKYFLDPTERHVIDQSAIPIYVFFIVQQGIRNGSDWPQNRHVPSLTGKTSTGAFVTYQSSQDPLTSLGITGDLWLTRENLYMKEEGGTWKIWVKKVHYKCPYIAGRILGWSTAGHFKYLARETFRKERQEWPYAGTFIPNLE